MAWQDAETEDPEPARLSDYVRAAAVVALVVAVCLALRSRLQTTDVAMLLLLAVVVAAARYRLGPALLASAGSILIFDFAFVPPYYTLEVHDTAYFLTFGVMLAVAVTMSRLTARIRAQAEAAAERERRAAALYELNRELASLTNAAGQVAAIGRHLARAAAGPAEIVLAAGLEQERGVPVWPTSGLLNDAAVRVAAAWAYEHGEPAGAGTAHCAEATAVAAPLRTPAGSLGIALIAPGELGLSVATRRTLAALAQQGALALERTMLARQHDAVRLEVEAERLRTALLSSLSHDLRTPLGGIEGAASSLVEDADLPVPVRRELAETIVEEAHRMTRLISNLLDMMRLETGTLTAQKSWQPLEEPLGVALVRLDDRLTSHPVSASLPPDLPLVPIDDLLIEQVFINLLENAAKYTPPGTPITVSARAEDGAVIVEVADEGPGVPRGQEENVFRKFYRVPAGAASGGSGLGLTICRGIVAAHGGRIWVAAGATGGAAFRFTLPLDGAPPGPPPPEPLDT
jgi:two-component system sensor histidine kinase KdpD